MRSVASARQRACGFAQGSKDRALIGAGRFQSIPWLTFRGDRQSWGKWCGRFLRKESQKVECERDGRSSYRLGLPDSMWFLLPTWAGRVHPTRSK
jgi:hypothetical protein